MNHKYRGKHNGGWKNGYLSFNFETGEHEIVNSQGVWPVISDSVGMWTGKNDEDGREIFHGDIVSREQQPDWPKTEYFKEVERAGLVNAQVIWKDDSYGWKLTCLGCEERKCMHDWFMDTYIIKVIGNTKDNPKLLEK